MARPPTPPTNWASTGSKIAPSAGKVAAGWTVNERPPAEWINYLDNNRDAWLTFLNDCTRGQPIADLLLNFANTDMFAPLIDVTTAPPASGYRLVQRVLVNATQHANVYAGNGARRFVFTFNASWGGSSWLCENSAQPAVAFALLGDGTQNTLELLWHAATGGSWGDGSWGRGNALVNAFNATSGTFTNLTVTQDLTVQRDIWLTRDLTVGRGVTVTEDVHCKNVVATETITAADATVTGDLTTGPVHVNSAHLYLAETVDVVHPGDWTTQPTRYYSIDISNPLRWPGATTITYHQEDAFWSITLASGVAYLEFPFDVPREASRVLTYAQWRAGTGAGNRMRVIKRTRDLQQGGTFAEPTGFDEVTSITQSTLSNTLATNDMCIFSGPINNQFDRYSILIDLVDGQYNRLYGVGYAFADPGPRNG